MSTAYSRLVSPALIALSLLITGSTVLAAPPTIKPEKHASEHKTQTEVASRTAKFATISASDKSVTTAFKATDLELARKMQGKKGTFTGIVHKAFCPRGNSMIILNFATDYKTAVTAVIRWKAFGEFPALSSLQNKHVLVTGVFKDYKGRPEMELTSPGQIKLVK